MIKKLHVLNGSNGHKFEVDKQYANGDDLNKVTLIKRVEDGSYIVFLEDNGYVNVVSDNILVFESE